MKITLKNGWRRTDLTVNNNNVVENEMETQDPLY